MKQTKKLMLKTSMVLILVVFIASMFLGGCTKNEEVIKIGAILPLTGPDSSNGISAMNGLVLAQEEINQQGGINGKNVELILEDYQGNPTEAVTSYKNIKSIHNPKVIFILGSPASMAVAPLANADEVFLFSISSVTAYSTFNDFTYRIVPSAKQEGKDTKNFIINILNKTSVGVIYLNNEYGVSTKKEFVNEYTKNSGNILFEEYFNQEDTDFRTQILKIQGKDFDTLYLSSWGKHAGLFIKQATEFGLENITYICTQACLNKDLIASGGNSVEGVKFPFAYMKEESNFLNKYKIRFGERPIQFSERMYDSFKILEKISENCDDFNKHCIKESLDNNIYEGTSVRYSYDSYGDIKDNLAWYTVSNGEFKLLELK